MTLFKQIALIVSTFLMLMLITILVLNLQVATASMKERLYTDAQNTASSLSLSLGSANGDTTMMSTIINANFDCGNYSFISLLDTDNQTIYKREKESNLNQVPKWFLNIVKLSAPVASANVSAGWSQVGILKVQSDPIYAYKELYEIFKELLISFSFIAILALVVLNISLAFILKPLNKIQIQAEAVTNNEFIIQEEMPHTVEFKEVILAINNMVHKLKLMFDKGNEELKRLRELEYTDQVTKLKNRKYLINKLPQYLKIDSTSKDGVSIMVALNGVIDANTKIGHQNVDKLFLEIAKIFTNNTQEYKEKIISRMNGTEFCVILPDATTKDALQIAKQINEQTNKLIEDMELDKATTYLCFGLYKYNYDETISKLLSFVDNALTKAKIDKEKIYVEDGKNIVEIMGKDAWKDVINKALKENNFTFISYKVVDFTNKQTIHNVLSLILNKDKNTTYSYGEFIAMANQLKLSHQIYNNVLKSIFILENKQLKKETLSFRLPYDYLEDRTNYHFLTKLLKTTKNNVSNLIIEIPDSFAYKNPTFTHIYKELFEKYKINIGVYEFINEGVDYKYLQDLRPIYIKAEAQYFLTQNNDTLSAIRLLTDTLNISLIATSVMDNSTLDKLMQKNINTIQGKVTA